MRKIENLINPIEKVFCNTSLDFAENLKHSDPHHVGWDRIGQTGKMYYRNW